MAEANKSGADDYGAKDIQVLDGLEHVRKRPGMYIGSTGYDGLHHLVKEIADNSIDEAIAGYATRVEVTLLNDGGCRVVDNGRGIPVHNDKNRRLCKRTSGKPYKRFILRIAYLNVHRRFTHGYSGRYQNGHCGSTGSFGHFNDQE